MDDSHNQLKDSVEIVSILKKMWLFKELILKTTVIFFIIGCLVALSSPILYESHTTFVPQTSDQNSSDRKGLSSLATLAGINLNAEVSSSLDNYLSPLLYSKIFTSDEFSLAVLDEELVTFDGKRMSIKDYILLDSNKFSLLGFIKKYTIGLFEKDKKNDDTSKEFLKDFNFISSKDYSILKNFKEKFNIEVNKSEGYIKVKAYDKDAFISTQLVKIVTKNLQTRIISLRTNKIKEQLDYSRNQYKKKQNEFDSLQNNLAKFRDSNKNISTALFRADLQKLESEFQLQSNILASLASEYNSNKIKLNKDTPIFSVLDEVSVPIERFKPQRKLIVLIYTLIGIILSSLYALAIDPLKETIKKIKDD